MRQTVHILLALTAIFAKGCSGVCYFPAALQGEFVTQSITSLSDETSSSSSMPAVSYSSLTVLPDSIPVWGSCHRRVGNNVILVEAVGDMACYKCFGVQLRSSNVLQIHTTALDKCYTTEERALEDCPTDAAVRERRAREIMLYRTKGFLGEPAVSPTYCPINGAFSFTYSVNDGTETSLECASHTSDIADCPYGFGFNLKFRGCSFGSLDMSFHCLGDWEGHRPGERYIALMDTQASVAVTNDDDDEDDLGRTSAPAAVVAASAENRPRYRCALYKEDPATGEIQLALSSDSTCTSHLKTASDGYETLTLKPRPQPAWPVEVQISQDESDCELPAWSQGAWPHLQVSGGELKVKDQRNFKTYSARCVRKVAEERFLVYARTHCGDEHFKCVWIKQRGGNAIEFQIGLYTSSTHNESLCEESNFLERTWVTQGRADVADPTPYPIIGEYTGVIPETDGLCAKLYSDCNNPEIMFYTIFNCFNRSEVFEEREYRCLGHWSEGGLIYTFTERRDLQGYECFVGLFTAKGDVYLREAGNNCERGQEPLKYGMRMSQVSKCYGRNSHSHRWRTETAAANNHKRPTAMPREREEDNRVEFSAAERSSSSGSVLALTLAAAVLLRP